MSVDLSSLLTETNLTFLFQMGGATITGGIVGFALKKILKILLQITAVIAGLYFASLAYLSYAGIITINWAKLAQSLSQGVVYATKFISPLTSFLSQFQNIVPGSAAFLTGLFVGFHRG